MSKREKSPFSKWFEQGFLDWQRERGERSTYQDFADWLERDGWTPETRLFSKQLIGQYMDGRIAPSGERLDAIAERLGDMAYVLRDALPPDPVLREIITGYINLPQGDERDLAAKKFLEWALKRIDYLRD